MSAVMWLFGTASMMWGFALVATIYVRLIWTVRSVDVLEAIWQATGRIHQELWIVAPIGIAHWAIRDWNDSPWMVFFDALNLFNWWYYRNFPEDNHWKRRAKKAKEAVAVRARRLVVVPAGASS